MLELGRRDAQLRRGARRPRARARRYVTDNSYLIKADIEKVRREPRSLSGDEPCSTISSLAPSAIAGSCCSPSPRSRRSARTTISASRSTPCPTSPTCRCRSTPRRPATRRSKPSSASRSPIETAMAGLPRLDYTRSISRYGLSQVTVVFEDGTDIYFARQRVARTPAGGARRRCRRASSPSSARSRPAWARSSCSS